MEFEHGEHADVSVHGLIEQQPDPITRADAVLPRKEAGQLICPTFQFRIAQGGRRTIDGEMVTETLPLQGVTAHLEQVLQAVARAPANGVVSARTQHMTGPVPFTAECIG